VKIPILRLGQILLTSIQVELTDNDALEFQHDVLTAITQHEALGIAIDITALDVVDSYLARIINETADMVTLLGAEVVVCGMQPNVALALVEMGRELLGVVTALNLEKGVEKIQRMIRERNGG
jgi:rsbT antagonist protein RsbS